MIEYKDSRQFVENYRKYLDNNGISSAHVARMIGISPQQLNNIYKKQELTVYDVQRLCTAIGYDCNVVITRSGI